MQDSNLGYGGQHQAGVTAADAKTIGLQEAAESRQSGPQGIGQVDAVRRVGFAQHAAAIRPTTSRVNAVRSSRVLMSAARDSNMASVASCPLAVTPMRSSAAVQSSVSAIPGLFCRSMRRVSWT